MYTKQISNAFLLENSSFLAVFSYQTPVFFMDKKTQEKLINRYSVTTSKHIGALTYLSAADHIKNGAKEVPIEKITEKIDGLKLVF